MGHESFSSFIGDFGNWSWVVLFSQTSFEETVSWYSDAIGQPSSELIPIAVGTPVNNPSGAIVELVDSDWTMILHRVGVWEGFEAAAIAQKLNNRIIIYEAEDTSGSSVCTDIAPNGGVVRFQDAESAETEADLYESMKEYADKMAEDIPIPAPANIIESYDEYLEQQGIILVHLSFSADFKTAIVDSGQEGNISRVVRVGNDDFKSF